MQQKGRCFVCVGAARLIKQDDVAHVGVILANSLFVCLFLSVGNLQLGHSLLQVTGFSSCEKLAATLQQHDGPTIDRAAALYTVMPIPGQQRV